VVFASFSAARSGRHAYCLVVNPTQSKTVIKTGTCLGTVTLCDEGVSGSRREETGGGPRPTAIRVRDPARQAWLAGELQLHSNPLLQEEPDLREEVLDAFEDHCATIANPGPKDATPQATAPAAAVVAPPVAAVVAPPAAATTSDPMDPWACPMIGLGQAHGYELRWCVDYRDLDAWAFQATHPLPGRAATEAPRQWGAGAFPLSGGRASPARRETGSP